MKTSKRMAAALLAACMMITSPGTQAWAYQGEKASSEPAKLERRLKDTEEITDETVQTTDDHVQAEKDTEYTDETVQTKKDTKKITDEIESPAQDTKAAEKAAEEPGILNFIMQESEWIQTPGIQNIAVSLGEEGSALESAMLWYQNRTTGQELTAQAAGIAGNMARFSMEYQSEDSAGIYELTKITWEQNGRSYRAVLAETDMEVVYGVNQAVEAEPDELLLNQELLEEVKASVVTMDENGNPASEDSVAGILGNTEGNLGLSRKFTTRGAKNMVIILDPGHDSTHSGASYHGYKEQDLVLKIAKYCKTELEKYGGITIYMTRETQSCPHGGNIVDSGTCNAKRVEFAAAKGADVYVSFHLNASASSSAKGVGVYYPNSNYRPAIGAEGKGLATSIYQKLASLGLSTWATGVLIRNSETNTQYPDGSLADYLAIIRRSKLAGFPAVLIEHAFLSNSGDVSKFLNTDAKLNNLGVADAQGIAAYYGLTLKGAEDDNEKDAPEISSIQSRSSTQLRIIWNEVPGAVSYEIHRSTAENGTYAPVGTTAKTRYDDGTAAAGTYYYYKVCAVFEDGEQSELSGVHAGKTLTQPSITKAVSVSNAQVDLAWNPVADATKYELFRSEAKDGTYTKIATLKSGKTAYSDKNVKAQTTYYYKLRARGGEKTGYSSYSAVYSGWAVKKTKIESVSSKTSTSLEIKWKKVSKAYGYRVQRSASKNGRYKTVATIKNGNTTKYVDKKLVTGKKYYYKVQTMNRVNKKTGYSGYCKAVSGSTITGATMVYARSKSSASMEVSWNRDYKATGYRIKRSTSKKGTYQVIANISGNKTVKYTDKTISTGKKYYYAVESVVKKNGVSNYSGNSKPVTARNLKRVSGIAMETGEYGVVLTWLDVIAATGYQIMRSEEEGGPYREIAKLKTDEPGYSDTTAVVGNRYYYKIRPYRSGKYTGYGSYTKALEKWVLETPDNLTAASQSGQIKLSWGKVPKAVGYEVFRSTDEESGYESIGEVTGRSVCTYTDDTALPDQVYYYKVAAIGDNGEATGHGDETDPVSAQIES